jgi:tetratricopeptide (TPR) repeat protein
MPERFTGCALRLFAAAAISLAGWGAEEGFRDLEPYLRAQSSQGASSPGKEVERFRTYAQLDRAYRLLGERQLDAARRELVSLLAAYPQSLRARTVFMELLSRTGAHAEVIEQAAEALRQQPAFIPAWLYRSRAYAAMGRLDDAIAGFEALLRQPGLLPEDRVSALDTLCELCLRARRYEKVLSHSAELLGQRASFTGWYRKGTALDGLGRGEDALAAYRQAVKTAGGGEQQILGLRAVAEGERKRKQWAAARDALARAVELKPGDAGLLRSLADTEYELKHYAQATSRLRRLLELRNDPADRESLANLLALQKDFKGAEAQYRALAASGIAPSRRAQAYRALSRIAEKQGDAARSVEYLNRARAVQTSRDDDERLANLLTAQGRPAEAGVILEDLLARARNDGERRPLLVKLGNVRMTENRFRDAAGLFGEAARLGGDAATLAAAAGAYERAGDITSAIEYGRQEVAQTPSAGSYLRLAALYEKVSQWPQALENLEAALGRSGDPRQQAEIHQRSGFAWAKTGDYEKARQSFERALALSGRDAGPHRALADTLGRLGRLEEAESHWRTAIELEGTAGDRRALAQAQERRGEWDAAVQTYTDLLGRLPRSSEEGARVCASLATVEARRNRHAAAAQWWLKAFDYSGGGQPEWLVSAAQSLTLASRWDEAANVYRRYLAREGLSPGDRARALEGLAFLASRLGDDDAAAGHFQAAIASGAASDSAHENLGFALARRERWREALEAFSASPRAGTDPHVLLAIALCHRKAGKPGLAVHFLEQALGKEKELSAAERRQAYADLGYLYFDEGDYDGAIRAWREAQRLEPAPVIALGLARLSRLTGDPAGAQEQLKQLDVKTLPAAQQAEYFDELAQSYADQGNRQESLKTWKTAHRMEPSARREFEIGLTYFTGGQPLQAIPYLEKAQHASGNDVYLQTLAYAYKAAGRLKDAALCFEKLASSESADFEVYSELGYIEMRRANNAAAERWFQKAMKADTADRAVALHEDLARLKNRWDLTMYQGYSSERSVAGASALATGASSVVPQGGGVEFAYQPPRIGFRNERTLQLVGRVLWNNEPGSIRYQRDSGMLGLGLRYKPLIAQNLQLSMERLIPVSGSIEADWMARAMWSWGSGFRLRPERRAWNYSLLFADGSYLFPNANTLAQFVQARQGVTIRVGTSALITPHAVLTARHQSPAAAAGSYADGGGGLSLRFLPARTASLASASSLELLFDCHRGKFLWRTGSPAYNGCRATAIVRF